MFEVKNPTVFRDTDYMRLALACAFSLLFHALAFGAGNWLMRLRPHSIEASHAPLQATLVQPPPLPPAPALLAPDLAATPSTPESTPKALLSSRRPGASVVIGNATSSVVTTASRQIAEYLLYPSEAIARGLEGEAQVMLFLDEAGNAVAARLELSSGHAILDDAAVRAARSVRSIPGDAPREVLLPVRFRLR